MFTHSRVTQRLVVPSEAYGHRSSYESACEASQWEDGDNDCPDQRHLVVLQLHVPALQHRLIDEALNVLEMRRERLTIQI